MAVEINVLNYTGPYGTISPETIKVIGFSGEGNYLPTATIMISCSNKKETITGEGDNIFQAIFVASLDGIAKIFTDFTKVTISLNCFELSCGQQQICAVRVNAKFNGCSKYYIESSSNDNSLEQAFAQALANCLNRIIKDFRL